MVYLHVQFIEIRIIQFSYTFKISPAYPKERGRLQTREKLNQCWMEHKIRSRTSVFTKGDK